MNKYVFAALLAALPVTAYAQTDDRTYCLKIGSLAARYIGSAGAEGRMAPDLNIVGAIDDSGVLPGAMAFASPSIAPSALATTSGQPARRSTFARDSSSSWRSSSQSVPA